ncbi:hypothetical protein [Pantoea sp. B65]|uniref:hypothetical protein n=1 Tax=Pantoea sp. B65 TaxID=2813359 RepID=UPI0039B5B83E
MYLNDFILDGILLFYKRGGVMCAKKRDSHKHGSKNSEIKSGKDKDGDDGKIKCDLTDNEGEVTVRESNSVEIEMTYRDNEVILRSEEHRIRGHYIIGEYAVTSGQDPNGLIYTGLRKDFVGDGKMTFRVGRKKSSDVARWFNNRVSGSQTTFNHSASELNFAFLGILEMTLSGGILGSNEHTFRFANIAFAQGQAGTSNNWWFGGRNCRNIGGDRVVAIGMARNGHPIEVTFWRGTNDSAVNVVDILHLSVINPARWMAGLSSSYRLNQIIMPASHNSGMSETSHCAPAVIAAPYSRTQSLNVASQLAAGVRFFDIRVDYDYGELVTYHRNEQWGCNGITLKRVLDNTCDFLVSNPTETAILKISHIRNDSGHDVVDIKNRVNEFLAGYSDYLYKNMDPRVRLLDIELGVLRSKILLVFDYSEHISPEKGFFRYHNAEITTTRENISVYDVYSNTQTYNNMRDDQLAKWRDYAGLGKDYLFLLSWILTSAGIGNHDIHTLSAYSNPNLATVLSRYAYEYNTIPNIVYLDFLDERLCQTIIHHNYI